MKVYRNARSKAQILSTYDALVVAWGIHTEEMDIATAYGTTHVIACGEKSLPPLILFHGVADDAALMWLYNAKGLAAHFRLYAIDTMGGPGKSCPNAGYNEQFDDVRWIDEVLAGLEVPDTVCTAGVSNGAYLAQLYALHRPERVRRAVCMAASVPTEDFGSMKTMMKIFLPEALFPTRGNAVKLLEKLCGKNKSAFTGNPLLLAHFHALLKGYNNMAMRHHKLIPFTGAQIDAIRPKCLYLVGEEDPFAKLGDKEALTRHGMNAVFCPGVGHGINHEIPEEINGQIVAYLA